MESLISVIIPVYNVETYLDYCMQSVFAQDYRNLEIILVDDGATDSSGGMCDEYAKQDARVKVIHKTNGGLSSARNAGLEIANGEYITFIDSDDYVDKQYINKMYCFLTEDCSDMTVCMCKKVIKDEDFRTSHKDVFEHYLYDGPTMMEKIVSRQIPMYAAGKLYKASLFRNVKFPEGRLYEDIPTNWGILKKVEKATFLTDRLYFYRQRMDSIVNTTYKHARMDQLYFSEEIFSDTPEKSIVRYAAASRCFFAAADNLTYVTRDYQEDRKYLLNALKKYRKLVLRDKNAEKKLKIMAMISFISTELVVIIGKTYKRYTAFSIAKK